MKTLFLLIALAAALSCAAQDTPTDLKLANGFVMKNCTIVDWEANVITVKYVGGTVPVRLEDLDPADRALLVARHAETLQHQASAEEHAAKEHATAEHRQQEIQEKHQARQQSEIDHRNAEIQLGLEQHHLVAGMTMDQVRRLFGPPLRSSSLTNVNASEWWIYPGLGKNEHGVPTNLQVHFKAGMVTRWNNTQH